MHSLVTDLDELFKVENSGEEVSPLIVFVKLYTRNEATFCESRTLPKPQRQSDRPIRIGLALLCHQRCATQCPRLVCLGSRVVELMDSLRASTAAPSRMRHERGESGSFCPPIPTRSQSADHTHKAAVWLR